MIGDKHASTVARDALQTSRHDIQTQKTADKGKRCSTIQIRDLVCDLTRAAIAEQ
jgi:hypothetical protein